MYIYINKRYNGFLFLLFIFKKNSKHFGNFIENKKKNQTQSNDISLKYTARFSEMAQSKINEVYLGVKTLSLNAINA